MLYIANLSLIFKLFSKITRIPLNYTFFNVNSKKIYSLFVIRLKCNLNLFKYIEKKNFCLARIKKNARQIFKTNIKKE